MIIAVIARKMNTPGCEPGVFSMPRRTAPSNAEPGLAVPRN